MSRYSRYFLQNILWLDDGLCRYYVQDPHWCHEEILDVPVVVYDQEHDAEQMLWACMEHNAFWVIDQLRTFLTDDCYGYHFVHKMSDQEVVKAVADELAHHIYQVVIEPGSGWAVYIDEVTDQAAVPVAVEPEPELSTIFEELKEQLDGLVAEQQKKYDQYEAQLAKMSDAEKAAVYGKKAGTGMFSFVGDIVNMVKAFPGFYMGYLKTLGKLALYPSQLSAVMAESMATGSLGPLEAEIDKFVKPVAQTHEEVKRYKGMLQVLLTDKETLELLHDFAERYYDATHPLELTEMGASAATDIVVTVLLAIFTAGIGAAANVGAKSAKLAKVAKLLERLAKVLKRVGHKHKLPKKKVPGARTAADIKKKPGKPAKGGMPEPESPKTKTIKEVDGKESKVVNESGDNITTRTRSKEFSNLDEANEWGNKHYNEWMDDLSVTEKESVSEYTGTNYKNINSVLRGNEDTYIGNNAEHAKNISNALKKADVPENIVVYRGASKSALGPLKDMPKESMVGKVIEDKGFMSTSMLKDASFNGDVQLNIKVPAGTNGAYLGKISYYPDEAEMLLDKGQKMIITGASEDSIGRLILTCDLLP